MGAAEVGAAVKGALVAGAAVAAVAVAVAVGAAAAPGRCTGRALSCNGAVELTSSVKG